MNELRSATLTRKFLMSLPSGLFIVSNLVRDDGCSMYSGYVLSPEFERAKQWDKIVSLGCNGRLCHIFKSREKALEVYPL